MKPRPNRCCILKLEEIPTTRGIFLSSDEQLLDETVVSVDLWLNIPCDFVDPAVGMPLSPVQSELLPWLSDSCCRRSSLNCVDIHNWLYPFACICYSVPLSLLPFQTTPRVCPYPFVCVCCGVSPSLWPFQTTPRVCPCPFVCVCSSISPSLRPFQTLAAVFDVLSSGVCCLPTVASFALTQRVGSAVASHFPWSTQLKTSTCSLYSITG